MNTDPDHSHKTFSLGKIFSPDNRLPYPISEILFTTPFKYIHTRTYVVISIVFFPGFLRCMHSSSFRIDPPGLTSAEWTF